MEDNLSNPGTLAERAEKIALLERRLGEMSVALEGMMQGVRGAMAELQVWKRESMTGLPVTASVPSEVQAYRSDMFRHIQSVVESRSPSSKPVTFPDALYAEMERVLRRGFAGRYSIKRANSILLGALLQQSPRNHQELVELSGFKSATVHATMTSVREVLILSDTELEHADDRWSLRPVAQQPWEPSGVSEQEEVADIARMLVQHHGYTLEEPVLESIGIGMRKTLALVLKAKREKADAISYADMQKALGPDYVPKKVAHRLSFSLPAPFKMHGAGKYDMKIKFVKQQP